MSFQAGIAYFDERDIAAFESETIQRCVRFDGYGSPTVHRSAGVFLAHAALQGSRRTPSEGRLFSGPASAITFDGRLDNRQDLLLLLRGALGANTSDRAIAAAAYETWGADGLARLIGDWSLVIWDAARKAILLASDFAGVRPLYYCARGNRVCWSSRLQPLVDWGGASEIDDIYVAGMLAHGDCPNRTPYRDVHPVPAGHAVLVTAEGTRIRRFWDLPVANEIRYAHEWEYEDHLRSLFREAVRCRIPADASCLCELSGGLDSSSVVATAAEALRNGEVKPERLVTLTVAHGDSLDKPFYTAMERFYGLDSIHVSTEDLPFVTEAATGGARPAFWEPRLKHTAAIARVIGATTYVTGQLGDLVMGNWWDDSGQVAGLIRKRQLGSAFRQAFAWSKVLRVPVAWILGRAFLSSLPLWLGSAKRCRLTGWTDGPQDTEDSIAAAFRKRTGLADTDAFFSREWIHARPERRKHFRSLMRWLELRSLQAPEPLEHLHYTHPYSHRPLVTFLLSIPADIVCRPGEPRRLMRRAFRELWPPELRQRRSKDGFGGVALDSLRPLANELLRRRRLEVVERGYVDSQSLKQRLERLALSLSCNEPQLRQIILLELWLNNLGSRAAKTEGAAPRVLTSSSFRP
jgi:hypothetical protein